jgi:histone H3/H4
MTLADSHVKDLLKEGAMKAGNPPSGAEWRVSPDAVTAAKKLAEDYLRQIGEKAARSCGERRQSTIKDTDVSAPSMGGNAPMM